MPRRSLSLAALAAALLAGCAGSGEVSPSAAPSVFASDLPSAARTPPASTPAPASTSAAAATPARAATPASAEARPALELRVVTGGLEAPTDIAVRSAAPGDLYVVEQAGRIRIVRDGRLLDEPLLDIADRVTAGGEQGLLGLAFDPAQKGQRLFVYYTSLDGPQVLASFRTSARDPDRVDPNTEDVLLKMADPFGNHNGGGLAFGPDGFLYVATGDGGGGGDPLGSGRDLGSLLAKILRLDVSGERGYQIPPGGPFVDREGARPEIWLTGLRNPWRIRFDRANGDLWIGDVGQYAYEEIDVARAGVGGLDFGWNPMEGFHCYPSGSTDDCDRDGYTLPVAEYSHDQGCSVTGGTVYRGGGLPGLTGWYVFADYCSGRVWVVPSAGDERKEPELALDSGRSISAIAEDAGGELFATDLASGELLEFVAGE